MPHPGGGPHRGSQHAAAQAKFRAQLAAYQRAEQILREARTAEQHAHQELDQRLRQAQGVLAQLSTTDQLTYGAATNLLLGGQRVDELTGRALAAFLGRGSQARGQFLDPHWVYRHREHADRPTAKWGRALVDDMLAQSRRVALRKLCLASAPRPWRRR